jgi:hypothetical protein
LFVSSGSWIELRIRVAVRRMVVVKAVRSDVIFADLVSSVIYVICSSVWL